MTFDADVEQLEYKIKIFKIFLAILCRKRLFKYIFGHNVWICQTIFEIFGAEVLETVGRVTANIPVSFA